MDRELERILCVDDEIDILEIAKFSLADVGEYTVQTCVGGENAMAAAEAFRPDIIILDVMMPNMDGPATLKNLRTNTQFADTPVIFMTAKVQPAEVDEFLQLGASGVIAKPFDPITLPEEVAACWSKFHAG